MSRKLLLVLLLISLGSLLAYAALRWSAPLPGIETKGLDSQLTAQFVSLATAIVSLGTAIVGLLKSTKK